MLTAHCSLGDVCVVALLDHLLGALLLGPLLHLLHLLLHRDAHRAVSLHHATAEVDSCRLESNICFIGLSKGNKSMGVSVRCLSYIYRIIS